MDVAVVLCLTCSSSLPPRQKLDLTSSFAPGEAGIITKCCGRPICPACVKKNPRLARYNPCLHCLGGVGAVSTKITALDQLPGKSSYVRRNIDGAVRDEDVFVLEDEDDKEDGEDVIVSPGGLSGSEASISPRSITPPPASVGETLSVEPESSSDDSVGHEDEQTDKQGTKPSRPSKHYIQSGDTLIGIALKYGVDGRLLCRLNSLPPSTLRTTPHLLHTRTVLILPPDTQGQSFASDPRSQVEETNHAVRRARERAEKRMQTITKEVDWQVAKAYVALAEVEPSVEDALSKETKEMPKYIDPYAPGERSLETRAIGRYMDDDEWEERERLAGRGVLIPRFPLFEPLGGKGPSKGRWRLWG